MAHEDDGVPRGVHLYQMMQDLRSIQPTVDARITSEIETGTGCSVESLANEGLLSELLCHPSASIRGAALIYVVLIHPKIENFSELLRDYALHDADPEVRRMAITGLGQLGARQQNSDVIALLKAVLADDNEDATIRKSARIAISCIELAADSSRIDDFCQTFLGSEEHDDLRGAP